MILVVSASQATEKSRATTFAKVRIRVELSVLPKKNHDHSISLSTLLGK